MNRMFGRAGAAACAAVTATNEKNREETKPARRGERIEEDAMTLRRDDEPEFSGPRITQIDTNRNSEIARHRMVVVVGRVRRRFSSEFRVYLRHSRAISA